MNSRQLLILSGAAIVIVAGAVWIGSPRSPRSEQNIALYPALKGQLQKATRVRIFKAGDQLSVELARDGAIWRLKQRHDFPADGNKVNTLLIDLENARVAEQKTSNPENYAALNVQDLSAANATGTRIEIDGVEPPVKLIVGKQDTVARTTYVRRAGEAPSWSVKSQLDVAADVTAWLSHEALNIPADRVQEVSVAINGEPRYSVVKTQRADVNFNVTNLPKNREVSNVNAPNAIGYALVNLQSEDVRPASELTNDQAIVHHVSFRTFDGLVVDLDGYAQDDKRWVIAKASFNADLAQKFYVPPAKPPTDAQPGDKKPEEKSDANDLAALTAKVSGEATALNEKFGNWAIAIPSHRYDTLFKPIEQLLKKKT